VPVPVPMAMDPVSVLVLEIEGVIKIAGSHSRLGNKSNNMRLCCMSYRPAFGGRSPHDAPFALDAPRHQRRLYI
jgi:hypothetical protein